MKRYKYLFAVALFALGMASCSDFLDAENKSSGGNDADSYFSSDASELLTTAYYTLKTLSTNIDMFEHGTDLYINTRGKSAGDFHGYTLTAENSDVEDFYTDCYNTINYANGVVYYAGEDSEYGEEARFIRNYAYYLLTQQFGGVPYITQYIASAETSYPRDTLSVVYESMIEDLTDLYNNSSLDDQNHEGRASKQAVAALLAKVYLAAGWDLHTTLVSDDNGTYTVNNTTYFTQAASWAEKAINGVSLTMSFEDKWSPTNEGNAEEIWSVQYDRASYPGDVSTSGHSLQNDYGGYYGECTAVGLKNVGSCNQQSEKSMALFEEGDERYEATFMTTFYNATVSGGVAAWGTEGYYAYYNCTATQLASMPIALKYYPYYMTDDEVRADLATIASQLVPRSDCGVMSPQAALLDPLGVVVYSFDEDGTVTSTSNYTVSSYNGAVYNGVAVKKFDDPDCDQVSKSNDYRDIVLLHVSDMYLVAAEAYLLAGNSSSALSKVNSVRTRAGLSSLSSFSDYTPQYETSLTLTSLDVILDERARELYAERTRWIDLRRTKQLVRYNVEFSDYISSKSDMCNTAGEVKWYRPIPATEISSNAGISEEDQNAGY